MGMFNRVVDHFLHHPVEVDRFFRIEIWNIGILKPDPQVRLEVVICDRFFDGGNQETLTKPIPIVLNKLLIDFFPEGGELVAGAPNRVYFRVTTPLGKPADLRGRVVDSTGQKVATAEMSPKIAGSKSMTRSALPI